MEGRVNACYFLDFEKFLQKKGKKGYYTYFGTLAIFASLDTKWPRYQNVHSTLFHPFFAKIFRNLKSNMYLLYPPINIIQIGPIEKKVHLVKLVRIQKWTFFFSSKISFTEICGKMTSFFFE